jgi:putative hydrolase of the HAD superfamily
MSSSPVLVLDIDGVVSLAQPGSPQPWYATLQEDWGLSHDRELAPEFFLQPVFMEVLRGRLDLYAALHEYFGGKANGLNDRLQEFVAYWFEKDAVIDRTVLAAADAWRQRTGGRVFAATNITASPICATSRGSARISTRSFIRRRSASASPSACSSPMPRRAWA